MHYEYKVEVWRYHEKIESWLFRSKDVKRLRETRGGKQMKRIIKLVRKFIDGIDDNAEQLKSLTINVEFGIDDTIESLSVFDGRIGNPDTGLSNAGEYGHCRLFEIYNGEFWPVDRITEMRLNPARLELVCEIIREIERYNKEETE